MINNGDRDGDYDTVMTNGMDIWNNDSIFLYTMII